MTIYNVLKEFVSSDGAYIHKVNTKYKPSKSSSRTANLKRLGYIEGIPDEPKTIWDLEGDDYCWVIHNDSIYVGHWCNVIHAVDKRNVGDIYLTEKEAKKELAQRKAKQILIRDTKGFKPNIYDFGQNRYYVSYNPISKVLYSVRERDNDVSHEIIFITITDAIESIEKHEKEWLTYLGVEE